VKRGSFLGVEEIGDYEFLEGETFAIGVERRRRGHVLKNLRSYDFLQYIVLPFA